MRHNLYRVALGAALMVHGASVLAEDVGPNQLVERNLIGYASEWTVRPGDELEVMVSTIDRPAEFKASLVRVVNGDDLTRYHRQFSLPAEPAPFTGTYQGTVQALNLGSYVEVAETAALDELQSFTVAAWLYPSFDPTEYTAPDQLAAGLVADFDFAQGIDSRRVVDLSAAVQVAMPLASTPACSACRTFRTAPPSRV